MQPQELQGTYQYADGTATGSVECRGNPSIRYLKITNKREPVMKTTWKNQVLLLGCAVALTACGGGSSGSSGATAASPPQQQTPAERIALLEKSGAIPTLDRTNSIAGPDANTNGVRDDVEAYINAQYPAAAQKAAALQVGRTIQNELLVDKTNQSALKALAIAEDRAVNCVYSKFDGTGSSKKPSVVVGEIESVTTNTKERLLAYLAFSKALNGTTGTIPAGDTCE